MFLLTTSLRFFNFTGTAYKLPASILSNFVFLLFKPVERLISLLSSVPTSVFKRKSFLLAAKLVVSTPAASFNYFWVLYSFFIKLNNTLNLLLI